MDPDRRLGGTTAPPDPDFVVRPARPADLRSFLDLYRRVVAEGRYIRTEEVPGNARRAFRRQFQSPRTDDETSVVAEAAGRVVGHLHIAREEHPVNRHVASLGMMVAPELRRHGIGSALMREALRWARHVGVEKVALSVYPDNEAARRLYLKFGFVEEGRLSGHSKKRVGYLDEVVMGLWLTPQSRRSDPGTT